MGSEYFDKMHKKIGANKLNPKEQKKLFEKFKKHGGEVIKKHKEEASPRMKENLKKKQLLSKTKRTTSTDKTNNENEEQEIKTKLSFFDWLSLYLNTYSAGITTATGNKYKKKFISKININLQKNLKTLTELIDTVINSKTQEGLYTKQVLYQNNIYDYELLKLAKEIYNPDDFSNLKEKATQNNGSMEVYTLYEPILSIYRNIYIFKQHYISIKQKLLFAYKIYAKRNQTINLTTVSKQIDTVIDNIFSKFIFSLHYAYCKIINMNVLIQDQLLINKLLGISKKDDVDIIINKILEQRKKEEEEEEEKEKRTEANEEQTQEQKVTHIMKKGKKWIEKIINSPEQTGDKKKYILTADDKIFNVYLILEEFEKELSFVLTSNKISFNVDWSEGQKWDPKKELNDTYIQLNSSHEEIKTYLEIEHNIKNINADTSLSMSSRRERLDKLSIGKTKLSTVIRKRLLHIFTKVKEITHKIIISENIIQDPKHLLYFDNVMDGNKKLADKSCVEAVELCNSYVEYTVYLMQEGKLRGASPDIQ